MKSKEFRIGNSILYDLTKYKSKRKDGEYVIIEAADDPSLVISVLLADIIPIKLTPELLLENGFIEFYPPNSLVAEYQWIDPYEDIVFTFEPWDEDFEEFCVFVQQYKGSDSICLSFVRYYHQWENLFFAINGREIGEKPEKPR
jgi:hypothetical protein